MPKPNAYIDEMVNRKVAKMIAAGELYTPEMVRLDINVNIDMWLKIVTVGLNRSLGIGRKRFNEQVVPEINSLMDDYYRRCDEDGGDSTHARSVIEREYNRIMEE